MMLQAELMQFPELANMIIPPIEQFIKRGRLVVSIEPSVKLPVISMVPLMSSLADAISCNGAESIELNRDIYILKAGRVMN